jgi:hypothetical protein
VGKRGGVASTCYPMDRSKGGLAIGATSLEDPDALEAALGRAYRLEEPGGQAANVGAERSSSRAALGCRLAGPATSPFAPRGLAGNSQAS